MQELLDALGYVGGSLDKLGPRPLRGLLAGRPRELQSIIPFSDAAGWTDPKEAASGRDVLNKWGLTDPKDESLGAHGAGILAEMALDPLGLALGGYGAYKAARGLGKGITAGARANVAAQRARPGAGFMGAHIYGGEPRIENAADFVGPRFPPEHGEHIVQEAIRGNSLLKPLRRSLTDMPIEEQARAYAEIPPGSKPLGSGVEAQALRTPYNSVIRISPRESYLMSNPETFESLGYMPAQGRPRIPEVLKPYRSAEFGEPHTGVRVEHLPLVSPLEDQTQSLRNQIEHVQARGAWYEPGRYEELLGAKEALGNTREIDKRLAAQLRWNIEQKYPWLIPEDVRPGNVSLIGRDRMTVHDPGIVARQDMVSRLSPEQAALLGYPSATQPDEELIREMLLRNSPGQVRTALKRMAGQGAQGQGILPEVVSVSNQMIHDPLGRRQQHIEQLRNFFAKYANFLTGAQL